MRNCYVFVDHLQPVAVSVSLVGEVVDVHSWVESVGAPEEPAWPNRQIWHGSAGLWVQDLPSGEIIEVSPDTSGRLSHRVLDDGDDPSGMQQVQRRLWMSADARTPISGWSFDSRLDGVAWSSSISYMDGSYSAFADLGTPASVLGFDVLDEGHASACIQKHNKRPWPFHPTIEMHVLRIEPQAGLSHMIVPSINVVDSCWPRRELNAQRRYANREELSNYLAYALGQHSGLYRLGAVQVRTTIRGDPDSGQAAILTFFTIEGVEFCRVDRPFDELGNLAGGLRDMNVSLVEDVRVGNLPQGFRPSEVNYI